MEYRKVRMSRRMSVGEWLERTIYELKYPSRLKPTSNWQVYVSLLHKLQAEGSVINMPVRAVGDKTFRQLIKWLLKNKGQGFTGTMKSFTALINRARRARLTKYVADFPYSDFAPKPKRALSAAGIIAEGGSIRSLSRAQWEAFLNMDLSGVRMLSGPHMAYWKEVFRDFCILLYELKSRPIDVLNLHSVHFAENPDNGRLVCAYVPAKKANRGTVAMQYLSPEAKKLIDKYLPARSGYIFPFPMNCRRWNLDNAEQFHAHYKAARNQLWKIDKFLHKVGELLELPFTMTLYAVRRTALTHAIAENRIPLPALAQMAGTSVRMLEKHYTNYLHTLEEY